MKNGFIMLQKEKLNLSGINTLEEFEFYAKHNDLDAGSYFKIKRDGTIIEFLITSLFRRVRRIYYNKIHTFYNVALLRAQQSENTYIEGI